MSNLNDFLKSFTDKDNNLFNIKNKEKNENNEQDIEKLLDHNNYDKNEDHEFYDKDNILNKIEGDDSKNINKINKNLKLKLNQSKKEYTNNDIIDEFFIKSETELKFKDKWIEIYNKAINSEKNTITVDKIKRGKFRINEQGKIEILPDHETYGKTSKILLKENWKLK